jgi:hypothetical protein
VLALVSVTELTDAEVSFQPMITTLRLPAVCAAGRETETVDGALWGAA